MDNQSAVLRAAPDGGSPSAFYYNYQAVVTVISGCLVVLGVTGSVLALSALRMEKKGHAASILLKVMLLSDLLMIVTYGVWITAEELSRRVVVMQTAPPYCRYGRTNVAMATAIAYTRYASVPLLNLAGCADSWSTVLVSVNRYVAICRPASAHQWYTAGKVRLQIGLLVAVLIALNVPLFFTTRLRHYKHVDDVTGEQCFVYLPRQPSRVAEYIFEYGIHPLFQHVFPLAILLPLNAKVLWSLRKARRYRSEILMCHVTTMISAHEQELERVMNSIVCISVVVFTLHVPIFAMRNLFYWIRLGFISDIHNDNTRELLLYAANISGLLYVSNSCINLIVYFFLRKTFRKKVLKLCFSLRRGRDEEELN